MTLDIRERVRSDPIGAAALATDAVPRALAARIPADYVNGRQSGLLTGDPETETTP